MKVAMSLSRWSKLDYVLGSIVATVLDKKIRPNDVIYGSGSHSCYGTVAKALKELDPTLSSESLRVICFAQDGVTDEPQHCLLFDTTKNKAVVNTWPDAKLNKTGNKISSAILSGEEYLTVSDLSCAELLKQYGK